MILIILCFSISFAYSEKFELMISTMGIATENVNGKVLNEEKYNKYSLFVYGSPNDGYSGQRWKNVDDGLWTNGSNKGEYWILGENQNGYEVHNHKFPMDVEPPTTPEQWRYANISNAESSWLDQSKYMDDYQKEYMLNSKLMRNEVTYNITALDIGLDKVRLENYATWTTKGSVYTERYDMQNKRWAANFMVPPMAGNARLEGYAKFPNGTEYQVSNDESSIDIPINYGAKVLDLSDYARKEHVKEIKSELYINDSLISSISNTECLEVDNSKTYTVYKNGDNETIVLYVTVKSSLITKFITDGALVDIQKYVLVIQFGEKEEEEVILNEEPDTYFRAVETEIEYESEEFPPPKITNVTIKRIVNGEQKDLLISRKTGKAFVCAGQTITISVAINNSVDRAYISFQGDSSIFTFDDLTKRFEWDEPRQRKEKTYFNNLNAFRKMYSATIFLNKDSSDGETTYYSYTYIIPYGTKQTLNSWSTLREKNQDAFSIDENQLFTRITSPYQLVVKASGIGGMDTKRVELDVFERWDTLYNRNISKYVK